MEPMWQGSQERTPITGGRVNAHQAVSLDLGIDPPEREGELMRVRPRPNDGSFELLGVPEGAERYRLNDRNGRLQRKGPLGSPYARFHFEGLAPGVYHLWLLGDGVMKSCKVVIARR
jgi:hypothetical protein